MNKKDLFELKRRFKKEECTFTRMCGCYVDGEKNKVTQFGETFLNLEDEEFYKYLELARKTLSGTLGNNLLELEFPLEEEASGGRQQFFMGLRESRLKNDALLDLLYDQVISHYDGVGNYLILVFHDVYDVITKTSDNGKLDESEEVFEYLLCAICPVELSKPGLGYLSKENKIGPRIRDWVVSAPESGFLFPSFTNRSSDIHSVICFQKNPKAPHIPFMESVLGCPKKRTIAEQKKTFEGIVKHAFGEDEEKSLEIFQLLQTQIGTIIDSVPEEDSTKAEMLLTSETIEELLASADIPTDTTERIKKSFSEEFDFFPPSADALFDAKAAKAGEKKEKEKEMIKKMTILEQQLEENLKVQKELLPEPVKEPQTGEVKTYDVILRVKPEKAAQITSKIIDGRKCLVIPMEENEYAAVNGVNTKV